MKYVLLPGMDGTGSLFERALNKMRHLDVQVLPLPERVFSTYSALAQAIRPELPDTPYILIAESFSGRVAAEIAGSGSENLKGIIFVNSFLDPPSKALLNLTTLLPLNSAWLWTIAKPLISYLCLHGKGGEIYQRLKSVVAGVPVSVLNSRLRMMADMSPPSVNLALEVKVLIGKQDRLISLAKSERISASYDVSEIQVLDGPHMLLQTSDEACEVLVEMLGHGFGAME
ncbi:serine aminopeptidase domain-containing protein [Simiduia agarivorans]|uniref:Serine aminopeptidase S33 domain-containing protein n=1 Tax=Simiduia agarivorans (strain DSM 21679 / JCM 13881 / BCRC 17597 / SA1) TaxID=1117647 RepID=K4KHA9_SIMAS|nr:alpha/beta hydrolase [Simiduia agarivorans]AFU97585.2 hypothetical protein M5M_01810 [Simiduia agarivorans SA1 = DSM 21679]